ncbi:MAG TPA: hypothetical protein VIQ02_11400 [Jiangellaceae bacterium]|jgi:hypothetical protein
MVERRSMSGIDLVVWVATLVAFPLAGLAGRAVAGPVDTVWTAALAGVIAGAVIGAAQWLALRRIGADLWWIVATAVGLAAGLALAFAIFGYGDTVGDLAVVGAVTGLGIGIAQWWLLRALVDGGLVWLWVPASAAFWALGWTVTTAIGVDPDDRWAVPGLSGAATVTVLLGGVLWILTRPGLQDRTSG